MVLLSSRNLQNFKASPSDPSVLKMVFGCRHEGECGCDMKKERKKQTKMEIRHAIKHVLHRAMLIRCSSLPRDVLMAYLLSFWAL